MPGNTLQRTYKKSMYTENKYMQALLQSATQEEKLNMTMKTIPMLKVKKNSPPPLMTLTVLPNPAVTVIEERPEEKPKKTPRKVKF